MQHIMKHTCHAPRIAPGRRQRIFGVDRQRAAKHSALDLETPRNLLDQRAQVGSSRDERARLVLELRTSISSSSVDIPSFESLSERMPLWKTCGAILASNRSA